MTARIVVSCDGTWDDGRMPCRGALPIPATAVTRPRDQDAADLHAARIRSWEAGWRETPDGRDLCPAHAHSETARAAMTAAAQQVVTLSAEQAMDLLADRGPR